MKNKQKQIYALIISSLIELQQKKNRDIRIHYQLCRLIHNNNKKSNTFTYLLSAFPLDLPPFMIKKNCNKTTKTGQNRFTIRSKSTEKQYSSAESPPQGYLLGVREKKTKRYFLPFEMNCVLCVCCEERIRRGFGEGLKRNFFHPNVKIN